MEKSLKTQEIKKYFETEALSNSLLGLLNTPRLYKLKMDNPDMEDDDKSHFRVGSALDCLLTTPSEWEEQFSVIDVSRPAGLMGKFIDELPDILDEHFYEISHFQEAYNKAGYKTKLENVIKKFWDNPEFIRYYLLTRDKSKTILSKEEADKVFKAKELIEANQYTNYYFNDWNLEETDGMIERHFQVPIYFKHLEENCKALLDGVVINHETKTIEPFDLKTTGKSVYDFQSNFISYGYFRQAAMYYLALTSEESPYAHLLNSDYVVLPFKFIVVETKPSSFNPAIIYRVEYDTLSMGLNGFTSEKGKYYKGINQLIQDYKLHKERDSWDLPIELQDSEGVINLSITDYSN